MHLACHLTLLAVMAVGSRASPLDILDKRASCAANNCARAVTGSNAASSSTRSADCSSFLSYTVIPATVTSTATIYVSSSLTSVLPSTSISTDYFASTRTVTVESDVTSVETAQETIFLTSTDVIASTQTSVTTIESVTVIFSTSDVVGGMAKRATVSNNVASTISPSAVPPYASACSGTVKYSSACSCLGISPRTTTKPAPSTTVYVTRTSFPTVYITSTTVVVADVTSTTIYDITSTNAITIISTISTTSITTDDTTTVQIVPSSTTLTSTSTVLTFCTSSPQYILNGGFEDGAISPFVFTPEPGSFGDGDNSVGIIATGPAAKDGTHYLHIYQPDDFPYGTTFGLTYQLTDLCPSQQYSLVFYSNSVVNVAGAPQCTLQYCINSTCGSGDPGQGSGITTKHILNFTPGAGVTTAQLSLSIPLLFPGEPNTEFCGRSEVNLDGFSITPIV